MASAIGPDQLCALVVEDEGVLALDLRRTLARLGYRVAPAARSGEEALSLAAQHHPNIVFMDLRIQGAMDGVETASRLRQQHDFALVYVTGGVDQASQDRAASSAPGVFLCKPFSLHELQSAIASALSDRSS